MTFTPDQIIAFLHLIKTGRLGPDLEDWPDARRRSVVSHFVNHHRMPGLTFEALCRADPGGSWFDRKDLAQEEKQRRMSQLGDLAALTNLLNDANSQGFRIGLFKGPESSLRLYRDPVLRQYKDFDLYVCPDQAQDALHFFKSQGVAVDQALLEASASAFSRYTAQTKDVSLPFQNGWIELHWRLLNPEPLSAGFDWQDCDLAGLGLAKAQVLCPVDNLYYHLCHGQMTSWFRLKWVFDVFEMTKTITPRDWEKIQTRAAADGTEASLARGLAWIETLLGPVDHPLRGPRRTAILGRNQHQLRASLCRADPRMNHFDYLFFSRKPAHWWARACDYYFSTTPATLWEGPSWIRALGRAGFVTCDWFRRIWAFLQRWAAR